MAVSVCIPCLNGAAHLESAVRSALAQTHADVEVVICENASTDDSPAIAAARRRGRADPRAREPAHAADGRELEHRGRAVGRHEHYVLLSADDVLAPAFAERCAAVFERHPELGHVWTERTDIDESGRSCMRSATSPPTACCPRRSRGASTWSAATRAVAGAGAAARAGRRSAATTSATTSATTGSSPRASAWSGTRPT